MQSIKILSRFEKSFQLLVPSFNNIILNSNTNHNLKFIPTTIFDRISHLDEHYINEISLIQKYQISHIASIKQPNIITNSFFISGIKTQNIAISHLILYYFTKNNLPISKCFNENEFLNISNPSLKIKNRSKTLKFQKKFLKKSGFCNKSFNGNIQNGNLVNGNSGGNNDDGNDDENIEDLFPLHTAAKKGDVNLFNKFAKKGKINQKDKDGKTPLFVAIESDQKEIVKIIVKNFQNSWNTTCFLRFGKSNISFSPLSYCVKCGENKCLDALINASEKISFQDDIVEKIGNLLHVAIYFGKHEILDHLLSKYEKEIRSLIEKQNHSYQSPLMLAASLGEKKAIYLLHKNGAKLENQDISQRTAMHYATLHRKKESIESLFSLGAELSPKDKDGKTPYDLVKESKDPLSKNICSFLKTLIKNPDKKKKYSPFDFSFERPHNLVFQGGGTKGFAYLGAIEVLEKKEMIKDVKRIAGTSAGAITATFLSMGYEFKEIKELFQETPFTKFLDHPFRAEAIKEIIKENTSVKSLFNFISNPHQEVRKLIDPLTWIKRLWQTTGLCEGEKLFEWIEKQIKEKTGIDYCTFGELKNLIDQGKPYKHLYVVGTKIGKNPEIVYFSSEDPKWKDLVISNTITISGSFPGVFKPRVLLFKDPKTKNLYKREDLGSFVDGGMICNFPIKIFDKKKYVLHGIEGEEKDEPIFNKRTLGFSLYSPEYSKKLKLPSPSNREIKNVGELIKGLLDIYLKAEILIRGKNNYNERRTVEINNKGISTFDFDKKKQKQLIRSGKRDTHRFIQDAKKSFSQKDKIRTKPPHPDFVERKEYLEELKKECIPSSWTPKTIATIRVLFGPGGIGKTELANYFSDKHQNNFSLVFPIASETKEKRNESYRELANILHIYLEEKDSPEKIREKVFNELENYPATKPWLLIYDNVTEEIEYPERGGSILITTRDKNFWDNRICREIRAFTLKESQKLIENITEQKDIKNIKALAERLGRFPLAITNASYYIAEEGLTIEEYLKELQEKNYLLQKKIDKNYPLSLQATWEITFQRVKKLYPKAFELLQLCAYFYSENIPQELVEEWVIKEEKLSDIEMLLRSRDLLKTLRNYSLIHHDVNDKTFSFHRLMQEVLQEKLEEEKNSSLYLKAVDLLAKKITEFDDEKPETWDIGKKWSSHGKWILKHSLSEIANPITTSEICNNLGNIDFVSGNYKETLKYSEKALEVNYSIHGRDSDHPDIAISLNNVGRALYVLGNDKEALNYFEKAVKCSIYDKNIANSNIANYLNNVGLVLRSLGNVEEALNYCKQALKMRYFIHGMGKVHSNIAHSLNTVGITLQSLGNAKKALSYHKKALYIDYSIHGRDSDHPDIANSLNNVGTVLRSLGSAEEALSYYKQVLNIDYSIYGKDSDHPNIANSLNNVGNSLYDLGNAEEALSYYKQSLEMKYSIHGMGKVHPDIADSLNNVGISLQSLGNAKKAFNYCKQALEMGYSIHGRDSNHSDIAKYLNNVGLSLLKLRNAKDALNYCKQALEMGYSIHGRASNHSDIANYLNNVGLSLLNLSNAKDALNYFKQALEMGYSIHGRDSDHPDIAHFLTSMGLAMYIFGNTKEALSYLNQALKILLSIHGKDDTHPKIVTFLNFIKKIQEEL
jgi:tetratricopeptide (TPR) repeat protein/predicted acylesterase/phospholipase RssA/ankyrin repeat protein